MRPLQQSPLKEECVAQALYANQADYPGELSFEKGDLLRIISQKPQIEGCSEGWWLCVDKNGKRGIAPGNRLQIMQRFDDNFFRVAQPFMDDFFAFHSSPFDEPFFRNRPTLSGPVRERLFEGPQIRRMNSCDDALKNVGIVRNIPIRVEKTGGPTERLCQSTVNIADQFPLNGARRHSDFPSEFRQTTTFGPPAPPRRSVDSLRAPELDQRVSSDEEERRSVRSERSPQRTLIIPSAVPGRTIEIPLGEPGVMQRSYSSSWAPEQPQRARSPKPETQLEKLTQRLKNLAARPFRPPNSTPLGKEPSLTSSDRSPSPSSSGIGADLTDSSHSGEENKRTSDLSSLSGSEQNEESRGMARHQPYMSRLVTQQPTSVIQAVFDGIERPIRNQKGLTVEEDMRRNETLPWNHIPTAIQTKGVGEVLEEEIQARKRVVLNKMSDCLRSIESAVSQINIVTAPQFWRVAHVLQPNLSSLRDAATAVTDSLEQFVDSTGRVSIDRNNPKSAEFNRHLAPLIEERRLIVSLRKSLDSSGWTVANLSRDRDNPRTMDSLEQFVSVAAQIPSDCRRMFQWIQMLVPSSTVIFLSPISKTSTGVAKPLERPNHVFLNTPTVEEKRLSSSSTSSTAASIDTPPSSILVTKPNVDKPRGRVTFADETTSNSSSGGDNSSLEYASVQKAPREQKDERIMEEDDLESVMSDRDSLFQDYAYLDDVVPGRSNGQQQSKPRINEEDRQIVRFYAPQLEQHTESLSHAIEEFLEVVEKHLPPREFVQKGKLIILAAHKLIYIGDSVSQCVQNRSVGKLVRECADELCDHLKDCVKATKIAAEEFPEIKSMQAMVDTIIAVSKAAHRLKFLIGECC